MNDPTGFEHNENKFRIKILLLGNSGVGCSAFIHNAITNQFKSNHSITMGIEIHDLILRDLRGTEITFKIWDLGGPSRSSSVGEYFVQGAQGAMVFFDLTQFWNTDSVRELVNRARFLDPYLPVLLVGTKLDLANEDYTYIDHLAHDLAPLNLLSYLATSSRNGSNVIEAFRVLTKRILMRKIGSLREIDLYSLNRIPDLDDYRSRIFHSILRKIDRNEELTYEERSFAVLRQYSEILETLCLHVDNRTSNEILKLLDDFRVIVKENLFILL